MPASPIVSLAPDLGEKAALVAEPRRADFAHARKAHAAYIKHAHSSAGPAAQIAA